MQRFEKNGSDISGEMLIGGLRMFQIMGGAFQGDGFGPKKSSDGSCKDHVLAAKDSHHGWMGNMSKLRSVGNLVERLGSDSLPPWSDGKHVEVAQCSDSSAQSQLLYSENSL